MPDVSSADSSLGSSHTPQSLRSTSLTGIDILVPGAESSPSVGSLDAGVTVGAGLGLQCRWRLEVGTPVFILLLAAL